MSNISQSQNPSYPPALVLALLILVNSFFLQTWPNITHSGTMDFFIYWAVPQCLSIESVENIYSSDGKRKLASEIERQTALTDVSEKQKQITNFVLEFYDGKIDATASPFLYTVIGLLSTGDFERDQTDFILFSLICYILSIIFLCRLLNFSLTSTTLFVILFTSWYQPLLSDLRVGNLNQIQLFTVTIYILLLAKFNRFPHFLLAGFVLGMGIMLKPNIILILPLTIILTIINKEISKCLGLLAGFASGTIIAFLSSGIYFNEFKIWIYFIESLPKTLNSSYPITHGNFSLSNLILSLTGRDFSVIIMTVLIMIFSYLNWKIRRRTSLCIGDSISLYDYAEIRLHESFMTVGLACAIVLVSSNLTWLHYYVLLIPLALFMIRPIQGNIQQKLPSAFLRMASFIALLCFTPIIMHGNDPFYQCILINLATVILIALTFFDIWYEGESKYLSEARCEQYTVGGDSK